MNENSNVFLLRQPDEIDDPLTNILRSGARQLLARAIELEAEVFLASMNMVTALRGRSGDDPWGPSPEERRCNSTHCVNLGAVQPPQTQGQDQSATLPLFASTYGLQALGGKGLL
jgi:hypothetical protein